MCCFPFLYTISQNLLFPSKKLLPVIRICRIQRCRRVIACHTVLGYEGSDVSIRVFVEQAVVSHAETDYHVQVGMCFVQQTGLQNRVALAESAVRESEENLRMQTSHYKSGITSLSELLDAQGLYQKSRNRYSDACIDYMRKVSQYLQDTGR